MALSETKIRDEAELESLLVSDPDQIEKGFIVLSNQRKAHGQSSMDILGLDSENVLTIVELKVKPDENQLRQALRYHDWVLQQGIDWFSSAYEKSLGKRQIAQQMPQIFLVAPEFADELIIEAKYLQKVIMLRLFRFKALSVGDKKEIVFIDVSIPALKDAESKPWTIDDNTNYISDLDVRALFVETIEAIRRLGGDVVDKPAPYYISFWVRGRKFGELYPKKKSFGSGFKVPPEVNNSKWDSISSITTKEESEDLITSFKSAYQLMKEQRS